MRAIPVLLLLILLAGPAAGEQQSALSRLHALPRADAARLLGSWEVAEMAPMKMVYEFRPATMAMHGRNSDASVTFELEMDADYRSAGGADRIWVIATNPRAGPGGEQPESREPSVMGVEITDADHATLVVSSTERFTLVRVR